MKKFVIFILAASILFSSCGMKWEQTVKNVQSNFAGGLDRTIEVKNSLTGQIEWFFTGKAYIDDNSVAGNVTIIYKDDNGNTKKFDAIGDFLQVTSIEL